jgi:PhzF family phenazine biosynthesis protein
MTLPLFVVDAFTSRPFAGNPAAVCPLEAWIPDAVMQSIAAENALSETAFFVRSNDGAFDLRWFTPTREVPLCGHATLASAFVVQRFLKPGSERCTFHTQSGALEVTRVGDQLALDLPARPPEPIARPAELERALGATVREWYRGQFTLAVLESARAVRALAPDLARIDEVCVTARGDDCDFVSRFFAPGWGIAEDPVTGSAHCTLVPYWSRMLGKRELFARQVSRRGGELWCTERGERVLVRGACSLYSRGEIHVEVA